MPRSFLRALFRRGLAILLILIVIAPAGARSVAGQSDDGLTGDQRYESPQLGYEVTWDDPWIVGERATRSRDVREDRLVLVHDDTGAELLVHGRFTEDTPQEVVDGIVEDRLGEFEDVVVEDQGRQSGVARAVLSYTGDDGDVQEYLEASSLEEDESVLLVDLIAPSSSFGATVDALGVVELDGDAVFSEEPSLPDRSPDDGTVTPPADEGPNRRRPRLPTDDAAEEPTEEAEAEDAVDGNTFTSPNFGFSISWDEDVWEVTATATDPDFDQLVLDTRDSSLSLSGTTDFDGNVGECLEGVTAFLSAGTEALEIDDIDVLEDEDGDPIEGEERDRAFVANEYTGTFEGDDAQFVYYVECRTL
ncbi:MAG TPA: hypothetical protein VGR16_15065, partial [Thermomicrobiales bacterium]|nr:hypothetical protein [Thermomicrobiales bacterium]